MARLRTRRLMADISSNNGPVSIPSYSRAGHVVIAIKATQGTDYTNPFHFDQANLAHDFGLTVVHYHYLNATGNREEEIAHFREVYRKAWRNGDYCAFDIEIGDITSKEVSALLTDFSRKTTHQPILYTYWSFFQEKLKKSAFPGNRLWMANYSNIRPRAPKPYYTVAEQYTDGQKGPEPHYYAGIGKCDGSIITKGMAVRLEVRKLRTRRKK